MSYLLPITGCSVSARVPAQGTEHPGELRKIMRDYVQTVGKVLRKPRGVKEA